MPINSCFAQPVPDVAVTAPLEALQSDGDILMTRRFISGIQFDRAQIAPV